METEFSETGHAGCSIIADPPEIRRAAKIRTDVSKSSEATNSWSSNLGRNPTLPHGASMSRKTFVRPLAMALSRTLLQVSHGGPDTVAIAILFGDALHCVGLCLCVVDVVRFVYCNVNADNSKHRILNVPTTL